MAQRGTTGGLQQPRSRRPWHGAGPHTGCCLLAPGPRAVTNILRHLVVPSSPHLTPRWRSPSPRVLGRWEGDGGAREDATIREIRFP